MARACLAMAACPASVVDLLTAYAEGLPFLVEELLAAWIGTGALVPGAHGWDIAHVLAPIAPRTFADTVERRLATLGTTTRRLLDAAAILGRRFDWTLLPAATGLADQDVLACLRQAIEVQLVMADQPRGGDQPGVPAEAAIFAFRHTLTRTAILAALLPPERTALAARMLALVEEAHAGLPDAWCDLAARLAEGAGCTERAAALLLSGATGQHARGAGDSGRPPRPRPGA